MVKDKLKHAMDTFNSTIVFVPRTLAEFFVETSDTLIFSVWIVTFTFL